MSSKEMGICLAILGMGVSGFVLLIKKMCEPTFQMKITQGSYDYSANVNIRTKNNPEILKIKNYNLDCLKNRGYSVGEHLQIRNYFYWNRIADLETVDKCLAKGISLSKEKLVSDCKKCNSYTEIIYKYDNIFGNEEQAKKKLYWHKYYVDELK